MFHAPENQDHQLMQCAGMAPLAPAIASQMRLDTLWVSRVALGLHKVVAMVQANSLGLDCTGVHTALAVADASNSSLVVRPDRPYAMHGE